MISRNIMYHFVGVDERLKGVSLSKFRAQLDFLLKNFAPDQLRITFDHGTIDHLTNAAPELEKRGLKGMFFILTMVQEERRVPAIDKQRFIEMSLRNDLASMMCAEFGIQYRPEEAQDYKPELDFYTAEERYFRYLRDKIVPGGFFEDFIGSHFERIYGDESAFVEEHYLSWDHVKDMHKRGHVIGSHGHAHRGTMEDFSESIRLIEGRIQERVCRVSYPNGIISIAEEDLRDIGIREAYTCSINGGSSAYQMGRLDCVHLREGV